MFLLQEKLNKYPNWNEENSYEVNKTWKSEFLYDRSFGKFIGNRLFSDCLRNRYWAYGQGRLVGCDDERVYIIEDKDISSYDIQDGKFIDTVTTLSDDQVLKSFYIFNDGYELIVMNKTNEQYISKNISIK